MLRYFTSRCQEGADPGGSRVPGDLWRSRWPLRARGVGILFMVAVVSVAALEAGIQGGRIEGEVFIVGPDGQRYVVPGARLTLTPERLEAPPIEVFADSLGRFAFRTDGTGRYRLKAEAKGLASEEHLVSVEAGQTLRLDMELKLEPLRQSVEVTAETAGVQTKETSATGSVSASTLVNAPSASERFEGLLPLLPGVVRGPDGFLNIKGARATQGGLLVNSANVTDPYTGGAAMNLPIDIVSKVEVLSNPFDAAYGKFAGAVTTVDTKPSEFDKFHFTLQNFFPRLRRRNGAIMGFESVTPRVTATGPLWKDRVAATQSFEYRFVRTRVPSLPDLQNDIAVESFDSFTQIDAHLGARQTVMASVSFFPQKLNNLGLSTFLPQESAPDLRQRGHLIAFQHKLVTPSGGLLENAIGLKAFGADLKPHSGLPFRLAIETAQGGFFSRQHRDTPRFEWQTTYHAAPLQGAGQHLPKAGVAFTRNSYEGWLRFEPVDVLRLSGLLAERIEFGPPASASLAQNDWTLFVQDKWSVHPRLTLDAGLRFDRDSVVRQNNLAPRLGFALLPGHGDRTVLRGGVGYFYDRANLNEASFLQFPERTVLTFSPLGRLVETRFYAHRLEGRIRNPLSIACSIQLDREIYPNVYLRLGYQQRNTTRDFILDPVRNAQAALLSLTSQGRSRYREFEATAHYRWGQASQLTASYVRSSAIGDLNDFNQFFGNVPAPLIRPNERSLAPFDAPNRFLFWGEFRLPGKVNFAPVFEAHSGFPYSVLDEERNYVGARNRAGRFPVFTAFDMQLSREFRIPFAGKVYKARIGFKVFNMFNSFNPRDLQNNLVSPRFGQFFNSVERTLRGKFVVDY